MLVMFGLLLVLSIPVQVAGYHCSRWLSDRRAKLGVLAGIVLPPALFLSGGLLVYVFLRATDLDPFLEAISFFVLIYLTPIGVVANVLIAVVVQLVRAGNRPNQPGN